ncbi:Ulp1 family isopeptidase [Legionella hackeliae]|uniref:Putative peptidase n=1 Tax=Legionella hackeliae TaxID=449 RepID=A0A0A8UWJ0_LEGHA|nr:Ulp1 family isopeptidase [Legionella hackeliae]KTD15170.1 Ubiquitin-like protease [Legionella hackeliae]CEK11467.1 putative peptidase [Legionella hackeliae]STX48237.1 Ubiquitin-like protease [Legionella hackeliae]
MSNTDNRRVREDYWYTSAQIVEVGQAWAQENPDRIFLYSGREIANRTALETLNVPEWDKLPKKILLPLNKGRNHWTAIAVTLNAENDQTININISFTDSLSSDTEIKNLDIRVKNEIERIEAIFREKYRSKTLNMVSSIYQYAWRQPDGSSCGPYSLANGVRCLDGKGNEPNPGRESIRKQQLNVMTQRTTIAGCSTNNAVDEILLDWIIHQTENGKSIKVTIPEDVEKICSFYAEKHQKNILEVDNIFHNEYCPGTEKPWFRPHLVNARVRELIGQFGIKPLDTASLSASTKSKTKVIKYQDDYSDISIKKLIQILETNTHVHAEASLIGKENISKEIDGIRLILAACTKNEILAFELMEQITLSMYKGNHKEAEEIVKHAITDKSSDKLEICLRLISNIIGARQFSKTNDEKFIYLASTYKNLAETMKKIQQVELVNVYGPKEMLQAYLQLLQGAIERNNASIIRQISFAINDFCSMLFELITVGLWKSDITRIERIGKILQDDQGNLSSDELRKEQTAVKSILYMHLSLEEGYKENAQLQSMKSN